MNRRTEPRSFAVEYEKFSTKSCGKYVGSYISISFLYRNACSIKHKGFLIFILTSRQILQYLWHTVIEFFFLTEIRCRYTFHVLWMRTWPSFRFHASAKKYYVTFLKEKMEQWENLWYRTWLQFPFIPWYYGMANSMTKSKSDRNSMRY